MARARFADRRKGEAEVNMTPLIDVSLVLVVILLLATPLAFESSLSVKRAQARGHAQEQEEKERINVEILSDDQLRLDERTIPLGSLAAELSRRRSPGGDGLVVVRCADAVHHGTFVQVLDTARRSGAGTVAVED
jgi:biopolymer transport protein ExbD